MDILKMKILNPIGSEEQLLDCFFGIPALRRAATDKKIACVSRHNNKVRRINGKKIFKPYVEGGNIYYYLNKSSETKYYYPIQYATIEIEE